MTTNLEKVQREKQRRLADLGRTDFASFVKASWPVSDPHIHMSWSWHHDAICEHMQAMAQGHITRLAIALPPRHTKSTIVSLAFNAWLWIHHPGERLLTASYALDLAIRDAERSRALMESDWYRTYYGDAFEFSSSQNVKSWYRNSQGGTRIATSVSGAATGEGGSYVLADDPSNIMDADSELERVKIHRWWDGVMGNRLNDQQTGRMVIVSQRTHKYDLIGHVLEQGGYEYLCLPAEYEERRKTFTRIGWSDPRTVEGEPLWPEKFPVPVLAERKRIMRLQYYSQYQQDPQNEEGSIIKPHHLHYYRALYPDLTKTHENQAYLLAYNGTETVVPANVTRLVISTDYAVSKLQQADFSVFLLWAVTSDFNFLLLDAIIEKVTGPEAEEDAAKWCRTYKRRLWAILVEDVAYQKSIIQRLQQEGFPVIAKHPQGDKVARAQSIAVYFRNGQFYFPEVGFPALSDILKNIVEFPGAEHDDVMDAVSILLALVQGFTPKMRDLEHGGRSLTPEEHAALEEKRKLKRENRELYKFLHESDDVSDATIGRY